VVTLWAAAAVTSNSAIMYLRTARIIANTSYMEYVFILRLVNWISLSARSTVKST
jgi:hypothetical protein